MRKKVIIFLLLLGAVAVCAETRRDSILSILTATEGSYRYGYEELAPDEQTWYDGIVEAVALFDANAGTDLYHTAPVDWNASIYTYESMQGLIKMLQRIYNDVPEMWHLYYIPRYENGTFVARIYKQNTPQNYLRNLQLLDSAYAEISKNVTDDMSLYDKILCLHDAYIAWNDYGGMSAADASNAKGALVDRKAVCEGLSRGWLYICQRAGLKCMYMQGALLQNRETDNWVNHAWNFMEVDGKWYLLDMTTDGGFPGVCSHAAFLKGQDYYQNNYRLTSIQGDVFGVYGRIPTLADSDCPKTEQHPTDVMQPTEMPQLDVTQPMFDLTGRRVRLPYKGIVIQQGRKYYLD